MKVPRALVCTSLREGGRRGVGGEGRLLWWLLLGGSIHGGGGGGGGGISLVLLLLLGRTRRYPADTTISDINTTDGCVRIAGGILHLLILRRRRRGRRRRRRRRARSEGGRAQGGDVHDRCIGSTGWAGSTTNWDSVSSGHDWLWLLLVGGRRAARRCDVCRLKPGRVRLLLGHDSRYGDGQGDWRRLLLLLLLPPVLSAGVCHYGKKGIGVWKRYGNEVEGSRSVELLTNGFRLCVGETSFEK